MFRTNRIAEDTKDIYFDVVKMFGKKRGTRTKQQIYESSKNIMRFLLRNRTYNIQLVGATGVGKSSFAQRLLRNTFSRRHTGGAIYTGGAFYTGWSIIPGSIAFPTSLGKIVFNISECRSLIFDPSIDRRARDEWRNIDAFFVMTSHQDIFQFQESERWIQAIRRVRGDVPIVLVATKIDRRGVGGHNLEQNIRDICARYGNIPYVEVSSRVGTNIHGPFLALQDILRTSQRNLGVDDIPNIPITPLLVPPPPQPAT